eukprot:m.962604 g.962604  ORF g.962604 m.962604 type:complete len:360 (-) comp23892_c0_seq11:2528-3607(-)
MNAMSDSDKTRVRNVLLPEIIVVNGNRYRKSTGDVFHGEDQTSSKDEIASSFPSAIIATANDNESKSSSENLAHVDKIVVPAQFMGKLIGHKGEFKRRLEADTETKISIPSRKDASEVVTIRGKELRAVESCRTRIELLIVNVMQSARPTHFLSIPLLSREFEQSLVHFRERSLELEQHGLSDELFTEFESFHLTLGTLKLYAKSQIRQAIEVLQMCKTVLHELLQESKDREIVVRGVEYMNDDPEAVDVLYAKVESTSLERATDIIVAAFREAGLLEKEFERDHVKLHATLINSKRQRAEISVNQRPNRHRNSFAASKILKTFKNYEFGRVQFDQLHLSKMAARRMNEYYASEAIVRF